MTGQDPYFATLDHETLYFNPSYFSYVNDNDIKGKVAMRYRDQWNNITSPAFRTSSIEAEFKTYSSYLDSWHLGVLLLNDQSNEGGLKQNSGGLILGYSRKLSSSRNSFHQLTFGTGISINRTNTSSQDLWFSRQYDQTKFEIDPNLSSGETLLLENQSVFNLDIGVRWHYKVSKYTDIKIGYAAHHINTPTVGLISSSYDIRQRNLLSVALSYQSNRVLKHLGGLSFISQSPSFHIVPSYGVTLDFPDSDQYAMDATLSSRISKNANGLSNDAIIINVGLQSSKWKAGFAYEITTSRLNVLTRGNGALELRLAYYLNPEY